MPELSSDSIVEEILREALGLENNPINPEAHLCTHLGADSIDFIGIECALAAKGISFEKGELNDSMLDGLPPAPSHIPTGNPFVDAHRRGVSGFRGIDTHSEELRRCRIPLDEALLARALERNDRTFPMTVGRLASLVRRKLAVLQEFERVSA